MKQHKRFLSIALACALSLSLAVPAMAATGADGHTHKDDNNNATGTAGSDGYCDICGTPHGINGYNADYAYVGENNLTGVPDTDLDPGAVGTYKDESGRTVPFIGVIKPTRIKATIPTQVVFDLDPTIDVTVDGYSATESAKTDQVTQPTAGELKVVNNSTVPMFVYVANVSTKNATLTQAVADVKDDTKPKNVMFALTPTAPATADTLATANDWMKPVDGSTDTTVYRDSSTKTHYLLNKYDESASKFTPVAAAGTADNADTLPLYINAVSLNGWAADETFTVMPTIIVAVHDPDKPVTYTAQKVDPATDVIPAAVAAPTFSGNATDGVTLTQADGAAIYYTTNGTTPTVSSTNYTGAITITAGTTTTIRAIAVKDGMKSPVVSGTYTAPAAP